MKIRLLLLLVFLLSHLPVTTPLTPNQANQGFFSTYTTTSKSFFNNWITPTPKQPSNISYFFYNSNKIQVFQAKQISLLTILLYDNASNNSALIELDLGALENSYNSFEWTLTTEPTVNVTLLSPSGVVSQYFCEIQGNIELTPYLGESYLSLQSASSSPECAFLFQSGTNFYQYNPVIVPVYLSLEYLILLVQLTCIIKMLLNHRANKLNMRTLSLIAVFSFQCLLICKLVNLYQFFSTNMSIPFIVLFSLNIILLLLVQTVLYGISLTVVSVKWFKVFIYIMWTSIVIIVWAVAYNTFNFVWSSLLFPGVSFLAQTVRNYILRNTHVEICYWYYLGILGLTFAPPIYYFICPNLFLIPFSIWKTSVWCILVALMTLAFLLEFKFFFKPRRGYRPSFIQKFDYLFADSITDKSLLEKQNMRISGVIELRDIFQGVFEEDEKEDLLLKLIYEILSLDKGKVGVKEFGEEEVPDCAVCYGLVGEEVGETGVFNKEQFRGLVIETKCRHFFHFECLVEWLAKVMNCPLCRKGIEELGRGDVVRVKVRE